jgi:MFS family permease
MATPSPAATKSGAWYGELTASHWRVLTAAFLGYLFDGYETYALFLVVGPALRQMLPPSALAGLARYAGIVVAATLLGWAIGGVIGGILADYWGRKRTMMATILWYALFTGLTALAHTWPQMALCRLLTGLGLGGEWATGAALVAETWPTRARSKGQSIMQSAFGWGALLSTASWYFLAPAAGPSAWRYMFLLGVVPALFVFYIRRNVAESEQWIGKHSERKRLRMERRRGATLSREQAVTAKFTVAAIFGDPTLRRYSLLCMVMSLGTTVGYWAISSWIPSYVEAVARATGAAEPARFSAQAGMYYTAAGILMLTAAGFIADSIGRRAMLAIFFAGSLLATPLVFLWSRDTHQALFHAAINGLFTSGQFSWMAIYPPELFPTAVRGTAISFVFNSARFISFLGPLLAGLLIAHLGGFSTAAMIFSLTYLLALCAVPFLPETKGKPLPT